MFAFDVTDSMLYGCVTVLLHVLLLLFTFFTFYTSFIIFCFYVLWAYAWNKDGLDWINLADKLVILLIFVNNKHVANTDTMVSHVDKMRMQMLRGQGFVGAI